MLYEIFCTVLKMNVVSSAAAAVLLLIKCILQKVGCPRRIMFVLWAVIAFRLICPAPPSTALSPFNIVKLFEKNQTETVITSEADGDFYVPAEVTYYENRQSSNAEETATRNYTAYIAAVWLLGAAVMLAWGAVSYVRMKRRLKFSVKLKDNIYISDRISTSFVFGTVRPKIYIPAALSEQSLFHVIVHEKTHIRRCDHISKAIGYILLSVHWFNPLNWLMFRLFSDDMEISCDEIVLDKIGLENKGSYLDSMLRAATERRKTMFICSAGFSINLTKRRIESMIKLKKSSKVLSVAAVVFCAAMTVAFGTDATEPMSVGKASEAVVIDIPTIGADTAYKAPTQETEESPVADSYIAETFNNADVKNTQNSDTQTGGEAAESTVPIIKSNTVSEELYIGFEKLEFESLDLPGIQQELLRQGLSASVGGAIDLSKNFAVREYGYGEVIEQVKCDANGNISLHFDLNSESFVGITFYDSETKADVGGYGILADGASVYTFLGFEKDKVYDVVIEDTTRGEWKIEGRYIIY